MKIKNIDHFVITTADLQSCLDFYVGTLGMEHRESNGHHNLYFPGGKISIHTKKGEFQPAALNPSYGSQDFCLIIDDDLENVQQELAAKGITPFLFSTLIAVNGRKSLKINKVTLCIWIFGWRKLSLHHVRTQETPQIRCL